MIESFAQNLLTTAAQAKGGTSSLIQFAPILLMFVVFWFLLIRPQKQQQKKRQEMLAALQKGDKVITTGGIYGTITEVSTNSVKLRIAENVIIRISRAGVTAKTQKDDE